MRKDKDILDFVINTAFVLVQPEHQDVFSYIHTRGHQSILLIANFRDREVTFDTAHLNHIEEVLLSNYDYFEIRDTSVKLPPFGALLLKVTHE